MTHIVTKINDFSVLDEKVKNLLAVFDRQSMLFNLYHHPPVFTVEEGVALNLPKHIPGRGGKSLFLKDGRDRLWLVVAGEDMRVDLKGLARKIDGKRFSFASPDVMLELLGVTPGSATPFALINDKAKQVNVIIDETFAQYASCVFHPLDNRYSIVMAFADLLKFIDRLGYRPHLLVVA